MGGAGIAAVVHCRLNVFGVVSVCVCMKEKEETQHTSDTSGWFTSGRRTKGLACAARRCLAAATATVALVLPTTCCAVGSSAHTCPLSRGFLLFEAKRASEQAEAAPMASQTLLAAAAMPAPRIVIKRSLVPSAHKIDGSDRLAGGNGQRERTLRTATKRAIPACDSCKCAEAHKNSYSLAMVSNNNNNNDRQHDNEDDDDDNDMRRRLKCKSALASAKLCQQRRRRPNESLLRLPPPARAGGRVHDWPARDSDAIETGGGFPIARAADEQLAHGSEKDSRASSSEQPEGSEWSERKSL
jgi:hypothetical protein